MSSPQNNEKTRCLNCNASITSEDKFCSKCGQENRELKLSFWELISEFLSSNFNFDTKLGRTLADLIFKPGEITKQFNAGKRIRYVKPVQMYFFVSFVYFLLLGLEPRTFVNKTVPTEGQLSKLSESEMVEINVDGTELEKMLHHFEATDPDNEQEMDTLLSKIGMSEANFWERHLVRQGVRSMNPKDENALTQEVYANLSIAMFFLLPLFAMLLWLFTKSTAPFYIDAIVFSLHFHCVALLILSANMLVGILLPESTVFKVSIFLILLYLWIAIRRVFELTLIKSLGKTLSISLLYSILFGLTYLVVALISFWVY